MQYGIMLCPRTYGIMVNHECVVHVGWSRDAAVEAVLWLGQRAGYFGLRSRKGVGVPSSYLLKIIKRVRLVGCNCNSCITVDGTKNVTNVRTP